LKWANEMQSAMLIAAAAAAVLVVSGASASRQLFGSGGPTCTMDSWCAWQPDASCPTPAPTQMLKEFPSCSWTEASIDGDLPLDNNNNVNNNLRVNNNDGSEAFCDQDGDKANWIEFDKDLHGGALTVRGFDSKELDALVTVKHAYKAATDLSGCGLFVDAALYHACQRGKQWHPALSARQRSTSAQGAPPRALSLRMTMEETLHALWQGSTARNLSVTACYV